MRNETWDLEHEMREGCLTQGELMAYLDGVADPAVARHVADCPDCAERLEHYRQTLLALSTGLYRVHCPPPEHLALYQLGLLTGNEHLIAAQHVRECPHCQRELRLLAQTDEPALAALLAAVKGPVRAIWEGQWLPRPAAVAARGPEALRRYQVQGLDVILRVRPADDWEERWNLLGRVVRGGQALPALTQTPVWLGPAPQAQPASQVGDQIETAQATIDDLGYFEFRELAPGSYTVGFLWDDAAILVRDITIP